MSLTTETRDNIASVLPVEVSEFPIQDRPSRSKLLSFFSRKKSDKNVKEAILPTIPPPPPEPVEEPVKLRKANDQRVVTSRSRSITWSSRNSKQPTPTVKPIRPRALTTWDPPPLLHAYTQAVMHSILDVPSSFSDLLFRNNQVRRSSICSDSSSILELQEPSRNSKSKNETTSQGSAEPKHKRNVSSGGSNNNHLTEKLFVLVNSGYILQYNAEGLPDRLPEKILELGPNSVAIASDALPGRHWVLRISNDSKADQLQTQPPSKNSWSRLPFRSAETKRLVKDFLLVFESARSFDAWLTSVRKEIEALGGLEYQPDLSGLEGEVHRKRPTHRMQAQKDVLPLSKSSSHLPISSHEQNRRKGSVNWQEEFPAQLSVPFGTAKSTPSSSIGTVTDLDRLRDSTNSVNRSSANAPRRSVDTSTPPDSGSPAYEYLQADLVHRLRNEEKSKAVLGPNKSSARKVSITEASANRGNVRRSSSIDPSLLWSLSTTKSIGLAGDDNLNTDEDGWIDMDTKTQQQIDSDFHPNKSRPISTIAPLPTAATLKKSVSRYRRESGNSSNQSPNSPPAENSMNSHGSSASQDSTGHDSSLPRRTPSYTLFPKRNSSLGHARTLSGNSLPSPPMPSLTTSDMFASPEESFLSSVTAGLQQAKTKDYGVAVGNSHPPRPASRMSHHKNVSNNSGQMDFQFDYFSKPKRSPAVTEAHLSSVFGTQEVKPVTNDRTTKSPKNEIKLANPVAETASSRIATTTIVVPNSSSVLEDPISPPMAVPVLTLPPPRKERSNQNSRPGPRVSSQKSMPNLSSVALQQQKQATSPPPLPFPSTSGPMYSAGAPMGPPPSVPLPAVPAALEIRHHKRTKSSVSSTSTNIDRLSLRKPQSPIRTTHQTPPRTYNIRTPNQPQHHRRTTSSTSSAASLAFQVSPSQKQRHHESKFSINKVSKPQNIPQHRRKLSSVSTIGSLGSLSAWVAGATASHGPHAPINIHNDEKHESSNSNINYDPSCLSPASSTTGSDILPHLTVGLTPSPGGLTPVTPTFPTDSPTPVNATTVRSTSGRDIGLRSTSNNSSSNNKMNKDTRVREVESGIIIPSWH